MIEMKEVLLYFACLYLGDNKKMIEAIKNKEKLDFALLEKYKQEIDCNYITLLDNDYPSCFKEMFNPPLILFYKGNITLLNKKKISVIGSRNNTKYGKECCNEIIPYLVNNDYVIVSGVAKGIDGISQQLALNNNGYSIGVIGSGFNHFYPKENLNLFLSLINKGLVISEYPPFVKATKDKFLRRNELIAALGNKIVVIEGYNRSGTLNTVMHGLNIGKDIYCVPTMIFKQSICNLLIKDGANIITKKEDILE